MAVLLRVSTIAAAAGGRLVGPDVEVRGASFDTRTLRAGELFVPLVAERDGHDFIDAAIAAGAAAYLTSRPVGSTRPAAGGDGADVPAIEVADTAAALMTIAADARRRLDVPTVGVTGSVGKTSTKELIAAAVGAQRRVTANERSFNNEQGLPVTILGAADDTEVLVLEMGMRGFGEISRLCDVGAPTVGVITRVGAAHAGRLGGIAGVARAKAELVEALPPDGVAVLNADDPLVAAMVDRTRAGVLTFGTTRSADVAVDELMLDALARASFTARTPWGAVAVQLAVSGEHMALNALAALAVAGTLGVDLESAAAALGRTQLADGRMTVHRLANGARVIDDAYNANPTSVAAGLQALAAMAADRRVAVLGLMAELDDPLSEHREIAALAAALDIELLAVDTDLYGKPPVAAVDVAAALGELGSGAAVLVKGSLVAGLQAVAARLVAAL